MPDNVKAIIDDVLENEGGSKLTNSPADKGGRTQYGISEATNPQAWEDGKVTEEEARTIYEGKYFKGPGFDKVLYFPLQSQLVDFGVNSGPGVAIQKLQKILGVKQDGILGPATLKALGIADSRQTNNLLVAERIRLLGRIVSKNPSQLQFLNGWLSRALEFLV